MKFIKSLFGSKETTQKETTQKEVIDIKKSVVDLSKKAKIQIDKKGLGDTRSQVVLVMDISGSMRGLYNNGTVQKSVERLLPLGMNFDDDGEIDIILFGSDAYQVPSANLENIEGYVEKEVLSKYKINQGTRYSKALKLIQEKYKSNKGDPVFVMFVTDGDNSDKPETTKLIRELSKETIFFQFIGIGNASFPYLEKLDNLEGRFIDNAGFMKLKDISTISEDKLYNDLLNEYPNWLKEAKNKGMI